MIIISYVLFALQNIYHELPFFGALSYFILDYYYTRLPWSHCDCVFIAFLWRAESEGSLLCWPPALYLSAVYRVIVLYHDHLV